MQCAAGTFGNEQGLCVACGKGYYQDLPGQTYCTKCYLEQRDKSKDSLSKHYCERVEEKVVGINDLKYFLNCPQKCIDSFFRVIVLQFLLGVRCLTTKCVFYSDAALV